jgi:hypothetical protein
MIPNPGTLLSRVLEAVTKPRPRMEKLQEIAAVLRETAGFRWVGLYEIDHAKGEVINLVWDGPAPPEYPVFPIGKGRLRSFTPPIVREPCRIRLTLPRPFSGGPQ